jgi:hypothetical protein
MPPEEPTPPNTQPSEAPDDEAKEKLRQIRANFTRSQTITTELETYYAQFVKVRAELDDTDDGLAKNLEWSQGKKTEMTTIVAEAAQLLAELKTTVTDIEVQTQAVAAQHAEFDTLAATIFNPTNGLQALFTSAQTWYNQIVEYKDSIETTSTDAIAGLAKIRSIETQVQTAYDEFAELKDEVDDPKTGIKASLEQVRQYANDALEAKTGAESNALSVTALKEETTKNHAAAKASLEKVQKLKDESVALTDDIRNNLDLSSAESLSEALRSHTKKLDKRLKIWGGILAASVILLVLALGTVFFFLYIYHTSASDFAQKIDNGPTLVSVISKILFTSPLVFAVYFSASNFSRVRDLRDRYAFKETVAKNLQAYVKLLKTEFSEAEYKPKRLSFTLRTMHTIYRQPESQTRKRKYNIGNNKIFQFQAEQEDMEHLEEKLVEGVEDIAKSKTETPPTE